MLILLEGAVLCLVFTALIAPFTLKNPAASIVDYPPAIRKRCAELGIFPARSRRFTKKDLLRKGTAALIFALIAAVVLQLFYNYIVSKIDSLVVTMEDTSITLVDILTKYSKK